MILIIVVKIKNKSDRANESMKEIIKKINEKI